MVNLLSDLPSSIRVLCRRPVVTAVSVAILAVGLSATIAVFNYVNAYSQPFPGVDHRDLVRIFDVDDENPYRDLSYLDFLDYAAGANQAFEEIGAVQPYYAASVRREGMTEVGLVAAASGGYFSVLRVATAIGRGLALEDDNPAATPVAVLSHSWWQRSFNGDPSVLGTTLYLNFRPFTIVGVSAPEFVGGASDFRPDVWIPIAPFRDRYTNWARRAEDRDDPLIRVYGRLRDGSTHALAQAELLSIAGGLDAAYPSRNEPRRIRLDGATWIDPRTRLEESSTVRVMLGAATGLLVLVCANVANLLLAIAGGRRRELALRAAIGASPGRLARQILAENVLMSTLAGLVALAIAGPATARLGSYFARPSVWGANIPRETSLDLRVVMFALAIAMITGLVAGLLPAIRASRRNLVDTLKTDTAVAADGPRSFFGIRWPAAPGMLVTTQIALAVVLVVTAGLVVRTLSTVRNRDPGFPYEQLVAAQISVSSTEIPVNDRERFLREMAADLELEPWVRTATPAGWALLASHPSANIRFDGHDEANPVLYATVMPGFFDELEIDLLEGRGVLRGDSVDGADVALINQSLALRYFPDASPIGRRFWRSGNDGAIREFEIVGVVADVMTRDFLVEPEPVVYFPYAQQSYGTSNAFMIAPEVDPAAAVPMIRRWMRDYEPYLAIINVLPYRDVVSGFVYVQRMNAELFSLLAVLGLALAAVGVFGVMSLTVTQRTREVGIRMALGARSGDISGLMLRFAMTPVLMGLGIGLAVSFGLTELTRSLLFGVEPGDPIALVVGTATIVVFAFFAAYIPSRRAAAADPVTALRSSA